MQDIRLKRAYLAASPEDGTRVLVERLWPRGVGKAAATLAWWDRDIAPSPELRRWYGHQPARWEEFRSRYRAELAGKGAALARLRAVPGRLTLVLAARDVDHSSAAVLRELLLDMPLDVPLGG